MSRRAARDRRRGLLAALAVMALANAAVFAHVAWNRAGGATARLALTDREMFLPRLDPVRGADEENTGIELRFQVQETSPGWLDRAALGRLGFDVSVDPAAETAERHYRNVLWREAWLVLEQDGEAWARWLAERREEVDEVRREVERGEEGARDLRAEVARLRADRLEASRLFVVDAGRDREALRERYAASGRHAVVPGTVHLGHLAATEEEPARLVGSVALQVPSVQVPLRLRGPVERAIAERLRLDEEGRGARLAEPTVRTPVVEREPRPPVLRVEIAFGRLGEPWPTAAGPAPADERASDSQAERSVPDTTRSMSETRPGER